MGAIHFSIDPQLAALLARSLDISVFIETGTFKGDSVALMSSLFRELHTCELSPELHAAAVKRFENDPAIHCHLGPSPVSLSELAGAHERQPLLYWLDAHWCSADHTAGEESQCPLLEEIAAIAPLHPDSVVWIDDARYFMAPPLFPLESRGWPTFQQVITSLQALSAAHDVVFANDTILFYPRKINREVMEYLRHHGADWLAIAHASRIEPELRAQIEKLCQFANPKRRNPFARWLRSLRKRLGVNHK